MTRTWTHVALACILASASLVGAAPPKLDIPAELKPVEGFVVYEPPADVFQIDYRSIDGLGRFPTALLQNKKALVIPVEGKKAGRYKFWVAATNDKGELATGELTVVIGTVPKVDPVTPPGPKPDEPPTPDVGPVTSFRVLLVRDNSKTYTAEQIGVLDGVTVEKAMTAATAGDGANFAWRRIDVNADPSTLPAGLRKVWTDAQKSIVANASKPPLIVVQVNDTIHIDSLATMTPAEAAAHITKLRGK